MKPLELGFFRSAYVGLVVAAALGVDSVACIAFLVSLVLLEVGVRGFDARGSANIAKADVDRLTRVITENAAEAAEEIDQLISKSSALSDRIVALENRTGRSR